MGWNVTKEFSSSSADEPTTKSISITENVQQYLILVLGSSDGRDYKFTTATYDGDDLTRIHSIRQDTTNGDATIDMLYIDISDKATGSYDLYYDVSTGGPDDGGIAILTVTGGSGENVVTDTFADKAENSGVGNPSTSVTTEEDGSIVIDAMYSREGSVMNSGANQTKIFDNDPGDQNTFGMSYKEPSSAGSTTMSWTNCNEEWAQVVVAFSPTSPLTLSESDSISLSENTGIVADRILSVSDTISILESEKPLLRSLIDKSESISISENYDQTVRTGLSISIWKEWITLSDEPEFPGPRDNWVEQRVTVSEYVNVKISNDTNYAYKPSIKVEY